MLWVSIPCWGVQVYPISREPIDVSGLDHDSSELLGSTCGIEQREGGRQEEGREMLQQLRKTAEGLNSWLGEHGINLHVVDDPAW